MSRKKTPAPARASSLIEALLKRCRESADTDEVRIASMWAEVTDQKMAEEARVGGISEDGTLWVWTSSDAWAQQFTCMRTGLAQKINEKLGRQLVERVRFSSRPAKTNEPEPAHCEPADGFPEISEDAVRSVEARCREIEDPEVRAAIRRALRAAAKRAAGEKGGGRGAS